MHCIQLGPKISGVQFAVEKYLFFGVYHKIFDVDLTWNAPWAWKSRFPLFNCLGGSVRICTDSVQYFEWMVQNVWFEFNKDQCT